MDYKVVIGCEVHVQLLTKTKAFCSCENRFGGIPNTRVCPVCLGLPGALPVVNKTMIEYAVTAGLALNCSVAKVTKFDRKNYMYPDLPKGYQISQYDMPICYNGYLDVETDGKRRRIRIRRLHMEEDAGKNIHLEDGSGLSYVDFNRCGTPLLEIVSEPDITSASEAVSYVQGIREIMQYLGISDCNMEEGSLRCDANINLHITKDGKLYKTPIVEVKNMNSFKAMRTALEYEIKRQLREFEEIGILEGTHKITRGYDDKTGTTVLQRVKEEESDYRYFPEPDLKPIVIRDEFIEEMRKRVGELPADKRERLIKEYGITKNDAYTLCSSKAFSNYFEEAAKGYKEPKRIANWVITEVGGFLNKEGMAIDEFRIPPSYIRRLFELMDEGKISSKIAKEVFGEMTEKMSDRILSPDDIVKEKDLSQITDVKVLEGLVDRVMAENPKSVEDYKNGRDHALKYLMGMVMKETRGKANPQITSEILRDKLEK